MQQMDANVASYVNDGRMPWVKLMLYEDQTISENPFPNTRTIGRVWIGGDGVEKEYVDRGFQGGQDYFERLADFYRRHPWVHAWEAANEYGVDGGKQIANLCQFTMGWGERMHQAGLKTVGFSISVGWPRPEDMWLFGDYDFECLDYIGLHEYSAPHMYDRATWHCLRYQRTFAYWGKPILITECGIDGGVEPVYKPQHGWKTFCSREEYWQQLQWYNHELEQDDAVVAAFAFTSVPEKTWQDFDFDATLSGWLRDAHLAEQTIEEKILAAALQHGISVAPGTALFDYIERHGWHVQDEERDVTGYRFRRAYADDHREYIAYCPIGQWHLVRHMEVPK